MEEDDSSKLSPELDLNQAVSNGHDEEAKGELGKEGEVGIADAEDSARVSKEPGVAKEPHASEDGVARVSEHDVAGNGDDEVLPSHSGHGNSSRSPSPGKPSPAHNNNRASSPLKRESSPPAKQTPSPVSRSKRVERSKSPSPKRRKSSVGGRRSSSRSPEVRLSRQSASRSPEVRHGRRREDSKRRHNRSRSPVGRSHRRERSRSVSPYERERKSRYSPRRRSSPPKYSSRGDRSPRKRPWSPPRNRNTGVGKPGNHLFVAGFSFATTERDLEKKFGRYGRVSDVRIIRDRRSGDSRGFGFLSLERDEEADDAIRGLDQTEWNGRIVLVEKAKTN